MTKLLFFTTGFTSTVVVKLWPKTLVFPLLDCDQCDDFYYGECPTHNFNIIEDNGAEKGIKMPNSMKSLPGNLYVKDSKIPEAGMGVFSKEKLEINTRFGPYRGVKVLQEDIEEGKDTSYMWEVRNSHYISLTSIKRRDHANTGIL